MIFTNKLSGRSSLFLKMFFRQGRSNSGMNMDELYYGYTGIPVYPIILGILAHCMYPVFDV